MFITYVYRSSAVVGRKFYKNVVQASQARAPSLSQNHDVARACKRCVYPELNMSVRSYSQNKSTCPKCGRTCTIFKCSFCECLIVPGETSTFFDVLGQTVGYDLTESDLKKVHRRLQAEFHPDKYSQQDPSERSKSEEISSLVNKAYSTLSNPYERGMYLLRLRNVPVNEGDIQLGTDFLTRIMESNEELEGISGKEELEKFHQANEDEIQKLSARISEAFNADDLASAKADLNKMKYFISIRNRLKEMERNLV